MKLQILFPALVADFKAVIDFYMINTDTLDLPFARQILHIISCNRAYDDTHPRWFGHPRILPHDGRNYCWYYDTGANDTHVATLLKAVLKEIKG